ncbi:MAG: family 16 glycoside hydrolase [Planctomycetota bacterium]
MQKLRVGLIGCGGRGRAHALGYQQSDKVQMVACADPVEVARQKMATDFNIPNTYADYNEMLSKEKLDIVSMALWTGLHYDAVMACVGAKIKLINAEKPMAPTFGEAKRMYEACEKAGIMMTFSHQRRFGPQFSKARDLLKGGAIGELIRMEGYCSNLFDWGTHWFDMMFFYNDDLPAEWVIGQIDVAEDKAVFGTPVESNGLSYIKWRNGITGLLVTGEDHGGRCQNRLIGAAGIIEIGNSLRVFRSNGAGWETPTLTASKLPGSDTTLYILESIDCLLGEKESILSSRKALQATELIFATYESARRRARVYLPLDTEDSALLTMLKTGEVTIPDWPARLSPQEQADGFKLIFNGKDLAGWKVVGAEEAWSVQKGILTCNGQGSGWIRPEGIYTDFILRLDYRISPKGNSGIFLRTSEEGRPAYQGMEIQILDDRQEPLNKKSTGAIYDAVAPTGNPSGPAGKWNTVEVSCKGPVVRVVLNNKEVVNCDTSKHPDLKDRLKSGFIGLQNHKSKVEFRSIRTKVLN